MYQCSDCRFCAIANGNYKYLSVDRPVYSNSRFYAIASIGALLEGWSLVVPKYHFLSMKSCYQDRLFIDAVNVMLSRLSQQFGKPVIAFEHGANHNESSTACGTAHAHLHLVPFHGSLEQRIKDNRDWTECSFNEIFKEAGSYEYLYYNDISKCNEWTKQKGLLHILKSPTSQFFRKILAEACGKIDFADYKIYPFLDVASKTRKALLSS
ncbi:MAG: hypothetical protein PWQ57_1739 [Desulfovibrionales bacterium]|nr:hypothetical protein [Desulfovibrionales bacterium]